MKAGHASLSLETVICWTLSLEGRKDSHGFGDSDLPDTTLACSSIKESRTEKLGVARRRFQNSKLNGDLD